ncbi:helix-turn-helix domain-containing protein [Butyrivibrio sp. CB08]|uniref:helix-turn-helix domain-containing protein n=1 Tax=Butyrivibrio sp. CB08 TaxID=2364879 RepID=UPI0018F59FF7|nr:helix-turn-helix transcriptional regulator [Butyrivibrio sp. CB08]
MPKVSNKENKNPYFKRREELKLTRDQASDLLESIPPERIEKIENERVSPHPDEIMIMADKYKSPELCNYYCSNQCPIGKRYVPEIKMQDLSQIVLNTVDSLNTVQDQQRRFINIAADGVIDDAEIDDFVDIQNELEKISIAVETLQLWSEQMLANGSINVDKYNARKNLKKKPGQE